MKPSASVLLGAVIVCGGWVSLPAVAFADETHASERAARVREKGAVATRDDVGACRSHAHAQGCTCARCAAASTE